MIRPLVFLFAVAAGSPALAQADDDGETLWSLGRHVAFDGAYLVTAPLRPTEAGVVDFLGGAGLVGVTMIFDEKIRGLVQRHPESRMLDVAEEADRWGSKPFVPAFTLAAIGVVASDPRLTRTGLEAVESYLFLKTIVNSLKLTTGRARPYAERGSQSWDLFGGTHNDRRSFSSARTANVFSIAVIVAEEYSHTVWPYVVYTAAGLAGVARIQLDAHWASDVVTSALLSLAVGKALVWLHTQERFPTLVPWMATNDGDPVVGLQVSFGF